MAPPSPRRLTLLPFTLWDTCHWGMLPVTGLVAFLLLGEEALAIGIFASLHHCAAAAGTPTHQTHQPTNPRLAARIHTHVPGRRRLVCPNLPTRPPACNTRRPPRCSGSSSCAGDGMLCAPPS